MLRKWVILITLIVLVLPVAGARADSMDDVFCGALSEADCQILLDNAAIMDQVSSAAFEMTMDAQTSGDAPEDRMSLNVSGSGSLAADPAVVGVLLGAEGELGADSMGKAVESLLTALSGEVALSLNGAFADEPFDMTLNLLLKDGVIVLNASAMAEMTGEAMEGMEWFGVDVRGALDEALVDVGIGTALDADLASALDEAYEHSATVARLPDDVVAGMTVAVFETSFESSAGALTIRQYIGLSDRFTDRVEIIGDMTLPESVIGEGAGHRNLVMDISIDLSAFNQPVKVDIPEDAFVFPLAMMMQMNSQ